jgi:hypothetical protein
MKQIGVRFQEGLMEDIKLVSIEIGEGVTPSDVARAAINIGLEKIKSDIKKGIYPVDKK